MEFPTEYIGLVKDVIYSVCRDEEATGKFCKKINLPIEELDTPSMQVRLDVVERVFSALRQQVGQEHVGLLCGSKASESVWGLVGHLVQVSPNLQAAMANLCQYYICFSNAVEFKLQQEPDATTLELIPVPGWKEEYPYSCRQCVEFNMAAALHIASNLVKQPIAPKKVEIAFIQPKESSTYELLFKAPVKFNATTSKLYFAPQAMKLSIAGSCTVLYNKFKQMLQDELLCSTLGGNFRSLVKREVQKRLGEHTACSIELIADSLCMSVRSLQRRLSLEGTSFHQEVEEVKKQVAQQLMKAKQYNISEISFMLGYNDCSAFRKAFKKWTGLNPKAFSMLQQV
ncbi:hypothetical protein PKOR_10460 [Pontibacter korlensis]|uniref:HTH araC/xylS-type domain-containing protein n=2 Tax=Pontibacter korlensis TaxID=400092 RepID=A0A0E3UWJ8_9BACT|nr:hypothetical protein PKOR_10460 [Pontibacter korlensis]